MFPAKTVTILLVEDDAFLNESFSALLATTGYTVLSAHNGRQALHLLRDHSAPFILITDLEMPQMPGWELIQEILTRRLPVQGIIVSTALFEHDSRLKRTVEHLRRSRIEHWVMLKPFQYYRVCEIIDQLSKTSTVDQ